MRDGRLEADRGELIVRPAVGGAASAVSTDVGLRLREWLHALVPQGGKGAAVVAAVGLEGLLAYLCSRGWRPGRRVSSPKRRPAAPVNRPDTDPVSRTFPNPLCTRLSLEAVRSARAAAILFRKRRSECAAATECVAARTHGSGTTADASQSGHAADGCDRLSRPLPAARPAGPRPAGRRAGARLGGVRRGAHRPDHGRWSDQLGTTCRRRLVVVRRPPRARPGPGRRGSPPRRPVRRRPARGRRRRPSTIPPTAGRGRRTWRGPRGCWSCARPCACRSSITSPRRSSAATARGRCARTNWSAARDFTTTTSGASSRRSAWCCRPAACARPSTAPRSSSATAAPATPPRTTESIRSWNWADRVAEPAAVGRPPCATRLALRSAVHRRGAARPRPGGLGRAGDRPPAPPAALARPHLPPDRERPVRDGRDQAGRRRGTGAGRRAMGRRRPCPTTRPRWNGSSANTSAITGPTSTATRPSTAATRGPPCRRCRRRASTGRCWFASSASPAPTAGADARRVHPVLTHPSGEGRERERTLIVRITSSGSCRRRPGGRCWPARPG